MAIVHALTIRPLSHLLFWPFSREESLQRPPGSPERYGCATELDHFPLPAQSWGQWIGHGWDMDGTLDKATEIHDQKDTPAPDGEDEGQLAAS